MRSSWLPPRSWLTDFKKFLEADLALKASELRKKLEHQSHAERQVLEVLKAKYLNLTEDEFARLVERYTEVELNAMAKGRLLSSPPQRLKSSAPGSRLGKLAKFVYSKKTYERVFEPIISDMRLEYNEALAGREHWHARWIHVRCSIAFCIAIMAKHWVSVAKLIQRIWTAAS
jgi:hypothetical protein